MGGDVFSGAGEGIDLVGVVTSVSLDQFLLQSINRVLQSLVLLYIHRSAGVGAVDNIGKSGKGGLSRCYLVYVFGHIGLTSSSLLSANHLGKGGSDSLHRDHLVVVDNGTVTLAGGLAVGDLGKGGKGGLDGSNLVGLVSRERSLGLLRVEDLGEEGSRGLNRNELGAVLDADAPARLLAVGYGGESGEGSLDRENLVVVLDNVVTTEGLLLVKDLRESSDGALDGKELSRVVNLDGALGVLAVADLREESAGELYGEDLVGVLDDGACKDGAREGGDGCKGSKQLKRYFIVVEACRLGARLAKSVRDRWRLKANGVKFGRESKLGNGEQQQERSTGGRKK